MTAEKKKQARILIRAESSQNVFYRFAGIEKKNTSDFSFFTLVFIFIYVSRTIRTRLAAPRACARRDSLTYSWIS